MSTFRRIAVLAGFTLLACACSSSSSAPSHASGDPAENAPGDGKIGDGAGANWLDGGHGGAGQCAKHPTDPARTSVSACGARVRPPGDAADAGAGAGVDDNCAIDADCTAGANGRCNVISPSGALVKKCTYDACSQDSDCGTTGVCGCGVGYAGQNVCLGNSDCRTDADCTGGEHCVLSMPFLFSQGKLEGNYAIQSGSEFIPKGTGAETDFDEALGYFCTTPTDTCDAHCGEPGTCTYDKNSHHWAWGYAP